MTYCYFKQQGFTLLELMVVIAIISILASFAVPTFTRQIAKAKLIEAQNLAAHHESIIEEYILLNGKFPSESDFSLIKKSPSQDSIVKSINVSDQNNTSGNMTIILNKSTEIKDDQFFKFFRDSNNDWHCYSNISPSILPTQCAILTEEE